MNYKYSLQGQLTDDRSNDHLKTRTVCYTKYCFDLNIYKVYYTLFFPVFLKNKAKLK